jgi:hypothetical protein
MTDTETVQEGGDDSLRATIEKQFDVLDAQPIDEAPAETAQPDEQSAADKARDERGRFAKKQEAAAPEAAPEVALEEQDSTPKPQEQGIPAPVHWKGSEKVRWEKLPVRVQEAIARDLEEQAKKSQGYAPLEQVLAPHRQTLAMRYGDEVRGVQTLLAYAKALDEDPAGTLQYIAKERGIDLAQLVPQQGQQFADPQVAQLHQQIQQLQQHISHITQRTESGNTSVLQSQIESFAKDPAHPYFNDVKVQMGALIHAAAQQGKELTMKQAYEMAVYADPVIRSEVMEQQRQREQAENLRKVNEAKAAKPIKGAPGTGGAVNSAPPSTVRGAIEEAWNAYTA